MGATFYGLGAATGALLGGSLYDRIGPIALFQIASGIAFIGLILFWVSSLPFFQKETLTEHEGL